MSSRAGLHPWSLFALALALRWAYALGVFVLMGDAGLKGPDSHTMLTNAATFAAAIANGTAHGWDWLGPSFVTMPLFNMALAFHALVFGEHAALGFVLTQGVIDAAACVVIQRLAMAVDSRAALWAGLAAAFNPTQIVIAGLVYTDTLFLLFVALFLLAAVRWIQRGGAGWAVALGLSFGAACLVRMMAAPFAPLLLILLVAAAWFTRRAVVRPLAQLAAAGVVIALAILPVLARNVAQHHAWSLTPQGGIHLALWVVPLVQEAKDGTPWGTSHEAMEQRTRERFGPASPNLFEESRRYSDVGREALRELGAAATAKAWLTGMVVNIGAPAILMSPPVSSLPRTGFYATEGSSFAHKVFNFIFRSESSRYALALLAGIAGLALMRLVQVAGVVQLAARRDAWAAMALFAAWVGYVLVVNGPVATPKYRLPIEPVLMVLTGAGVIQIRSWATRLRRPSTPA